MERDLGLDWKEIEARVESGALPDVNWGNQDRIERELQSRGERRELTDWFLALEAPA